MKQIKAHHNTDDDTLERWWRNKYRLPTSAALYAEQPRAYWMREYLADLMHKRDDMVRELTELRASGTKGSDAAALRRQGEQLLRGINALGSVLEIDALQLDAGLEHAIAQERAGVKSDIALRAEAHFKRLQEAGLLDPAPNRSPTAKATQADALVKMGASKNTLQGWGR